MKNYISIIALPLVAFFVLVLGFSAHVSAFDPFRVNQDSTVCDQTDASGNQSTLCNANGTTNPLTGSSGVINRIANIFALITGIAAVVVILVGGFEYVRSSGDSSKVSKAKDTIIFAVIGLVIVVVSRALVALAIDKL